jgi:hypothetical protein
MTFEFLRLVFLQDVYDRQHRFLIHALYDGDKVVFYVWVNLSDISNILSW